MDKLFKTIPAILRAAGASEEVAEAACIAAWRQAVGDGLCSQTLPVQLRRKTLVVAVSDKIWQRQLETLSGQLLFRLNSVLGAPLVRTLEWRIDPKALAERRRAEMPVADSKEAAEYRVPAELLRAAAGIADVELRRAFLGAATSCVRRLQNHGLETGQR